MIIKLLINVIFGLVKLLFTPLPNLPAIPQEIMTKVTNVFNVIFNNLNLMPIFVRVSTLQQILPILIIVLSFKHIYHIVLWIIHKIPLSID